MTVDVQRHVGAAPCSLELWSELTCVDLHVDWLHALAVDGGWQDTLVAQRLDLLTGDGAQLQFDVDRHTTTPCVSTFACAAMGHSRHKEKL